MHCKIDGKFPIYEDKMIDKYASKTCPSASEILMVETLKTNVI